MQSVNSYMVYIMAQHIFGPYNLDESNLKLKLYLTSEQSEKEFLKENSGGFMVGVGKGITVRDALRAAVGDLFSHGTNLQQLPSSTIHFGMNFYFVAEDFPENLRLEFQKQKANGKSVVPEHIYRLFNKDGHRLVTQIGKVYFKFDFPRSVKAVVLKE